MFSHGYSGNPYANSWFAECLARKGYIVACVKHYGNTHPGMIPELSFRPWHRPQDLSFVLDQLLVHPTFKDHIDVTSIGAAGFSQGVLTALWLAGIRGNLIKDTIKKQFAFINDDFLSKLFFLHFKDIPRERLTNLLDNFTNDDFKHANASYRDKRIKAVFAMAPGLGGKNHMFTAEGLSQAEVPVAIVVGEADDIVSVDDNARFVAEHVSQSVLTVLSGKITHWTLLNEGTEEGRVAQPYLTVDDPSVNRAQVHEKVGELALKFFKKHLG